MKKFRMLQGTKGQNVLIVAHRLPCALGSTQNAIIQGNDGMHGFTISSKCTPRNPPLVANRKTTIIGVSIVVFLPEKIIQQEQCHFIGNKCLERRKRL